MKTSHDVYKKLHWNEYPQKIFENYLMQEAYEKGWKDALRWVVSPETL